MVGGPIYPYLKINPGVYSPITEVAFDKSMIRRGQQVHWKCRTTCPLPYLKLVAKELQCLKNRYIPRDLLRSQSR
jgi:hypothetical protein